MDNVTFQEWIRHRAALLPLQFLFIFSFIVAPYLQLKKPVFYLIYNSFLLNAGESGIPFMENSLPQEKSSIERSSHVSTTTRRPLHTENVFILPNTQYYILAMGKVHNVQPFPWGLWGSNHPQRHCCWVFRPCWRKWLSQNFDRTILGKKRGGRGVCCPPIFLVT